MHAERLERAARAVVDDFPFLTMRDAMKRAQASGSERVPCFLNREHLEALEALRAALAAPEPACAEAAFASDDCPASDAALGSVWVDRDGAAWRKVSTAPDASGAVQHYHLAAPEPAPLVAKERDVVTLWRVEDEPGHVEWCERRPSQEPGYEGDHGMAYIAIRAALAAQPAQVGASVKKNVEDALAVAGTRVRGADDATWLLIAYERLCFMVASPESHTSKPDPVDAYGVLRGEIVHLLKAGMVPPNPAQAWEAVLVDAATYAMNDTARILSMGGVPRVEDIELAKQGIVARAVAHALRAQSPGGAA